MLKPKTKSYALVTFATDNIAGSQTPAAGGVQSLTLDGALAVGGVIESQALGYIIGITTADDETGRTFTITGTDPDGNAISEAVTGVDTGVALSTKFFRSISGITTDDDTAAAIEVGTVETTLVAQSPTYCLDIYQPKTSISVDVGGTINYSLKKCYQRPTAGDTLNFEPGGLSDQVSDNHANYDSPTGGVRLQVNSYSAGATVSVTYVQTRHT